MPRLAAAIAILVLGYIAAGLVGRWIAKLLDRTGRLDPTLKPVIRSVIRYTVVILVLVAALSQLGVETASILAALGGAAIAIALALQGTLANIAAGLMLLWLRPFRAGDAIETSSVAGTVEELNLFHVLIRTGDGVFKFVPNSLLWSTTITNYTRNPTRQVQIDFTVAYENDVPKGRKILADFAVASPRVLPNPPVEVVPLRLADSSIVLQLRAWTTTPDFWNARWDLTEGGKKALEEAGVTTPVSVQVIRFADAGSPAPGAPPPPTPPPGRTSPGDSTDWGSYGER